MTMATDPHIEFSTADGVCTVRIERPAKRNALTGSMYAALAAAFIAAVVGGQLLSSVLLDHFALLGLEPRSITPGRILGALMVIAGVACIKFL